MAQTHSFSALTYLQNRPLTPAASFALFSAVVFVTWAERRRTRISLRHLDDHLLKDVGISRHEALKESRLPFWTS